MLSIDLDVVCYALRLWLHLFQPPLWGGINSIEMTMVKKTLTESENFQRLAYAVGFLYRGVGSNIGRSDICDVLSEVSNNPRMKDSSYKDNFRKYFKPRGLPPKTTNGDKILLAIQKACLGKGIKGPVSYELSLEDLGFSKDIICAVDDEINKNNQVFRHAGTPFAVDTDIDPLDIDVQVRNSTTGELKAHLLYQSPVAAALWDKVKTSPFYSLHSACAKGLNFILQQESWKGRKNNVNLVLNLGVGSWSKDKLILQSLKSFNSKKPAYIWVDASFEMLRRTIKEKLSAHDSFSHVNFAVLKVDFEHPSIMRKLYVDNFSSLPSYSGKKAFFILGFTLSNLNESRFFSEYSAHCQQGDLFVFPMQFIPEAAKKDSSVLKSFKNRLRSSYEFDEGTQLAQAGLGFLQNYKLSRFVGADVSSFTFNEKFSSLSIKFSADLKSNDANVTTRVVTAQSSRHYKSDYLEFLNSLGFKLIDCSPEYEDGAQTLLVEFVGGHGSSSVQSATENMSDSSYENER